MSFPVAQNERDTLLSFLDFYRRELLRSADGLTPDQMQIALTDSGLTLSRLIGHMAYVEMTLAQTWAPEELREVFTNACADSDRRLAGRESIDGKTSDDG